MTAAEAIQYLGFCEIFKRIAKDDAHQIAALIERQAAEIERLNTEAQSLGEQIRRGVVGDYQELSVAHETMKQEIAKKDRMIRAACNFLALDSVESADHWRLMIEKEVERD